MDTSIRIIQLPKGYLSYSQLALWLSDKKRYKDLYFDERNWLRGSNDGQAFGKIVADALENDKETGDDLTDSAMLMLEKYDQRDVPIETDLKTKDGIVKLLIKPDTLDSVTKNFREYKTGKYAWTQHKANNHMQLFFYAMGIYVAYGVVLKETHLDWIETEKDLETGIIKPTGRIETFKVPIYLKDILRMIAITTTAAKEIEVALACHVPDPKYQW